MSHIIRNQIKELVEIIQEQTSTILTYSEKIPQIEIDIILGNLRKLYDSYNQLDKINAGTSSISSLNVVEEEIDMVKIANEIAVQSESTDTIVDTYLDFVATTFTNEPPVHLEEEIVAEIEEEQEEIKVEPLFTFKDIKREEPSLFEETPSLFEAKEIADVQEEIKVETIEEIIVEIPKIETIEPIFQEEIAKEEIIEEKMALPEIEEIVEFATPIIEVNESPVVEPAHIEPIIAKTEEPKPIIQPEKLVQEEKKGFNSFKGKPIDSLKKAIGINDKFQFINELFEGNMARYNKTIDTLDSIGNLKSAMEIVHSISQELEWDTEDKAFQQLENYLQRRYY